MSSETAQGNHLAKLCFSPQNSSATEIYQDYRKNINL